MGNDRLNRWTLTAALRHTRSIPELSQAEFEGIVGRIATAAADRVARRHRARDLMDGLARWSPWVFRVAIAAGIVGAVLLTRPESDGAPEDTGADSTATAAFFDAVAGSAARDQVVAAVVGPLDGSWALDEETSP